MRILAEIDRHLHVPHQGKIVRREAVRGIILNGQNLFMIHSSVEGDYKFPGGGVEPNELHEEALKREIAEESGAELISIPRGYGKVIEYDFPIEKDFDLFCMTSYYYVCEIHATLGKQCLDDYEAELGFCPVWVNIDDAILNNNVILGSKNNKIPRWVRRETQVLELIRNELIPQSPEN